MSGPPLADADADLLDRLLAQPGTYVGTSRDSRPTALPSVARATVTTLPRGHGAALDYENLNVNGTVGHAEHAILSRASGGGLVLCTVHIHAPTLTELHESSPGLFEAAAGSSPFPLAIAIHVPSPTRLVYTWSFGAPGGVRDVEITADLTAVT